MTPNRNDSGGLPRDPHEFARQYLPHHFRCAFNAMHKYSFEQYVAQQDQRLPGRRGQRLAIAAPRGSAKSTVHSLLLPVMDIAYQRERHIVIISATQTQACHRLANMTREFRNNVHLHGAFFGGKPPRMQSSRRCLVINDVRVEAYGCGAEMRGISHGEYRPTRIILDDVEASRNAIVPARRQMLLAWYDEVIENLGDTYTHITIVGTILHRKSLLSLLLERPGYRGEIYKSVTSWSQRSDLWCVWTQLYLDMSDPAREKNADAYLEANKAEMLRQTEVLWPEKESYVDLEKLKLAIGRAAFAKEKQNAPFSQDHRVFNTTRWTRFIAPEGRIQLVPPPVALFSSEVDADEHAMQDSFGHARSVPAGNADRRPLPLLSELKYFGFLDPALGRSTTRDGDYAAIVTIGRCPSGILYVMDVWMEKAEPTRQINRIFEFHRHYKYTLFGYEANGFQESMGKEIEAGQQRYRDAGDNVQFPIRGIQNTENKRARICLTEPAIVAGLVRFQYNLPVEFYNQADEFGAPRAHDDALDALAGCIEMIRSQEAGPIGIKHIRRQKMGGF
jgi:predicted phage terminase large subunit-like protein